MKHTPGPWKVAGQGDGNQQLPIFAKGKIIAAIRDNGSIGDANLIAAAPDLLEACEFMLKKLERITTKDFSLGKDKPARDLMLKAIAKAEGRESC